MGSIQSESVPVGYRFHPTDQELVNHYLRLKMLGKDFSATIAEVEVCKCEPWELPMRSALGSEDNVWFFFCPRDLKYAKSPRFNRMTKEGFWKATGKDRNVKTAKQVIGTKKTLVFHKGRVPNGVRTSWVMHEYHPLAIPSGQRAYVLCRLKKKPDENESSTEPSRAAAPDAEDSTLEIYDYEDLQSLIRYTQPPECDLSSMLHSQMHTEQGPRYMESSFANSFYLTGLQSHYGTNGPKEDGTDFVETFLNDQDEYSFGETIKAPLNDSSPPELLTRYDGLSSDTDAETAQARHAQILGYASRFSESTSSKQCRQMRMVQPPCRTVLSSNRDLQIKENSRLHDGFDSSSVDSESDIHHEIDCIFLDRQEPVSIRTHNSNYQPTSQNSVSRGVAPRILESQSSLLHKSVAIKKEEREVAERDSAIVLSRRNSIMESDNSSSEATSAKLNLKPRAKGSACSSDRKGSYIVLNTPPLSHTSSPPSVYFLNALVALLLFIVILWELFLYGAWC